MARDAPQAMTEPGAETAPPRAASDGWARFAATLDRFAATGRRATFWWRDDDAGADDPALARLLALAGEARPLGLAVIPMTLTEAGVARIAAAGPGVRVLPHGLAHVNHAPAGEKKAEFGAHRPLPALRAEAETGRRMLADRFGARLLPLFVPPWNRIAPALAEVLTADVLTGGAGWAGVSTFRARPPGAAGRMLNTHVDVIDWKGMRGFAGTDAVLNQAIAHLEDRLAGAAGVDPAEPTGLLTHHLAHDEAAWAFTAAFLNAIAAHPAADLVDPATGLMAEG